MKSQNISTYLILLLFTTIQILVLSPVEAFANTNPTVTNVAFTIDGTTVTVTYDVADAEEDIFTIYMEVSEDGGTTWDYDYGATTGDIGSGIAEGTNKAITWQYSGGNAGMIKIKILADDIFGDQIYYARKVYNTVTIGSQVWLKENLDVGVMINSNTNQTKNSGGNYIEKYCYYNNEANCNKFGGYYKWDEAMKYSSSLGTQGICPAGWHMPTFAEFQSLGAAVDGNSNSLKATNQGSGGGVGTNTSGFTAILGGRFQEGLGFYSGEQKSYFWSSNGYYTGYSNSFGVNRTNDIINYNLYSKNDGYNVRCIKD